MDNKCERSRWQRTVFSPITLLKSLGTIAILTSSLSLQSAYALNFHIRYIDNDAKDFESRGWLDPTSLFQRNVTAATKILGSQINSTETIELIIAADSGALRAGGGGTFWPYLYTDKDGINVWQDGSLSRTMLGINEGNGGAYPYDIQVIINPAFVDQHYWIEQAPETRSGNIPSNKGDFVSVVMHELIHGFGFNGFRKRTGEDYGTYYYSSKSVFDSMTFFGGNGNVIDLSGKPNPFFFDGPEIRKVYGSAIALTHYTQSDVIYAPSNFYHFGDCTSPAVLKASLMNGCVFPNGIKLNPTPVDLAVLADIGYPVIATMAVYSQSKLSLPSMKLRTKFYALEFKLIKDDPLVLELVNITERNIKLLEVAHMPEFEPSTGVLSIPRVQVGDSSYKVGLQLINSSPIQIQLISADILP